MSIAMWFCAHECPPVSFRVFFKRTAQNINGSVHEFKKKEDDARVCANERGAAFLGQDGHV